MFGTSLMTIERFIMQEERLHPEATGELSNLLYDIALASKVISFEVRQAGLVDILGSQGTTNIQGETQQKLDVFANETIKNAVKYGGRVCIMASEEEDTTINVDRPEGKYVLLFDPLDGSSNIDVNVSIGTIFSIYRRRSAVGSAGCPDDYLRPGHEQVAAGYIIYGSSTMMVYSTGNGVHGFTLDPSVGEFLLSHPKITTPASGKYYSVNESNSEKWSQELRDVVTALKTGGDHGKGKNARYIGSLVSDFHRNLIAGGVFLYPSSSSAPQGKLRLLYEASPLAFVAEHAGGAAMSQQGRILDIVPTELHQRTPLIIGSKQDVQFVMDSLLRARAA